MCEGTGTTNNGIFIKKKYSQLFVFLINFDEHNNKKTCFGQNKLINTLSFCTTMFTKLVLVVYFPFD